VGLKSCPLKVSTAAHQQLLAVVSGKHACVTGMPQSVVNEEAQFYFDRELLTWD